MITRSSLLHIRIPFSFFLLPVFLLAVVCAPAFDLFKACVVFFVLHFLLYPASNGFNSYYDRDTGSIGGLKQPPQVTSDLLRLSLSLDASACAVGLLAGWRFSLGCLLYGLASKAYSWNRIRIKKYPVFGWLFAGVGQGTLTFLLVMVSVSNFPHVALSGIWPLVLSLGAGFFILGIFPLTQIYQHPEDSRRGDTTMSILAGVRGTFLLSGPFMAGGLSLFFMYFLRERSIATATIFAASSLPAAVYFIYWWVTTLKNPGKADFRHTMRMNMVASVGLALFSLSVLGAGFAHQQ
jgi:4-hydroxybenzoate polyprenyltransferase